ncbi:UNVERIFIED_CONTAM: hypothetical protein ABIC26_000295 [Paenibacillus sp. PvR008]
MKNKKAIMLGMVCASVVAFTASTIVFAHKSGSNSPKKEATITNNTLFPINENGQTYGKVIYQKPEPDLLEAIGVDGTVGYILSEDIDSHVSTPIEAIEQQKKRGDHRDIPLYDKDGKTIIGSFKVGNNSLN